MLAAAFCLRASAVQTLLLYSLARGSLEVIQCRSSPPAPRPTVWHPPTPLQFSGTIARQYCILFGATLRSPGELESLSMYFVACLAVHMGHEMRPHPQCLKPALLAAVTDFPGTLSSRESPLGILFLHNSRTEFKIGFDSSDHYQYRVRLPTMHSALQLRVPSRANWSISRI